MNIKYSYVSLETSSAINIQMMEESACASRISISINCSSSVPSETSSIFIPIYTDSENEIFVGSMPSTVKLEFTPSVIINKIFTSQSSQWPSLETGYHIALSSNPIKGTQATQIT